MKSQCASVFIAVRFKDLKEQSISQSTCLKLVESYRSLLFQKLVKPSNGLEESLLFCKFLNRVTEIAADCETVRYATEQIDLEGLLSFLENNL